jgi:hypothetical protein
LSYNAWNLVLYDYFLLDEEVPRGYVPENPDAVLDYLALEIGFLPF